MVIINLKKTEKQLIDNEISERAAINYLIIMMVLISIPIYISMERYENVILTFVEFFIITSISIFGTIKSFEINKNGDNKDYFKRLIVLSTVSFFRLLLFYVPILVITEIIQYNLSDVIIKNKNIFESIEITENIALQILYFIFLCKSIFRVSHSIYK